MKKTPLFVSGVLATFVLVVVAGVLSAFRTVPTSAAPTATAPPVEIVETATPAPQTVTPQEAAQIAARIMNRTDLYAIEGATLDAMDVYKVTFSSGDIVYISPTGEVIQVVPAPTGSLRAVPSFGSRSTFEDGEHEDHDD